VGDRSFSLALLLLQKLNVNIFDRKPEFFTFGSAIWIRRTGQYWKAKVRSAFPKTYPPIPFWVRDTDVQIGSDWNDSITEGHDLFQMFHLIDGLSKKHGISVLYYSTNQNVQAQLEKGRDLKLPENTAVIKRAITREPSTFFLDLAASNPPEMFSDANEHLTPDGINKVAGQLMQAALLILGGAEGDLKTVPNLEQGPL